MANTMLSTKDLDLFGVPFMFTTNSQQYYKSFFGGIMSIISIVAIIILSNIQSLDLFERSHPQIVEERYPLINSPYYNLSNGNFFFGFELETGNSKKINPEYYFNISSSKNRFQYTENGYIISEEDISLKNCSDIISQSRFLNQHSTLTMRSLGGFKCIDNDNPSTQNGYGGNWTSLIQYSDISIYPCNQTLNSKCKPFEELSSLIENEGLYLKLLVPTYVYASSSLREKNPLFRDFNMIYIPLSNYASSMVDTFFTNITISEDQNYFVNMPVVHSLLYHSFYSYSSEIYGISNRINHKKRLAIVRMYFTKDVYSIKRSYMKIWALLSHIGGLFTIVSASVGTICQYYNSFLRNISLLKYNFNFVDNEQNFDFQLDCKLDGNTISDQKKAKSNLIAIDFNQSEKSSSEVIKNENGHSQRDDSKINSTQSPLKIRDTLKEGQNLFPTDKQLKNELKNENYNNEVNNNNLQDCKNNNNKNITIELQNLNNNNNLNKINHGDYVKHIVENYYQEDDDHPLQKIGMCFILKTICCQRFMSEKEQRLNELYKLSLKVFSDQLDITNYIKTINQLQSFKSIILNKYQNLSLNYLKKANLFNPTDVNNLSKEYEILGNTELNEAKIESIISIITYFKNLIELKDNNNQIDMLDRQIINKLDPVLKELIKKSV